MLDLIAVAAAGLAAAAQPLSDAAVPRIEIAFPRLIERYCSFVSPRPPSDEVAEAIARRLPDLVALWQREGPALLAAARRLTGRPYHFAEAQAVVHACEDMGSLSQPLLVSGGPYTEVWESRPSAADGRRRVRRPDSDFVNTLWHEVTHRYLGRIVAGLPGGTTPARDRHRIEDRVVQNHIHLFALEQLVYDHLGRAAEFEARRSRILERGDPQLARAHRIVMAEGAQALVAELRPAD